MTTTHTDTNKSKFEWMLDNIRIEKIILATIWATEFFFFFFFFEISALLDVRQCPKLQYQGRLMTQP